MTAASLTLPGVPEAPPATPAGIRRGIEVARVAVIVGMSVRCSICALGIAVDIVGQRAGDPERHDWTGRAAGHDCKVTRNGIGAQAAAALARLYGWAP